MLSLLKLKSLNMEELFFSTNESPSPHPVKPHNTFHPPFEFLYLESGDGGGEKSLKRARASNDLPRM